MSTYFRGIILILLNNVSHVALPIAVSLPDVSEMVSILFHGSVIISSVFNTQIVLYIPSSSFSDFGNSIPTLFSMLQSMSVFDVIIKDYK